jgi:hypothetical protein
MTEAEVKAMLRKVRNARAEYERRRALVEEVRRREERLLRALETLRRQLGA